MTEKYRPRILVFAGSARRESTNKQLARVAAQRIGYFGGDATFIDLRDYPMPIYDGDLEAEGGIPTAARELKAVLCKHQGLMLASPEYNGFITPLMKNTLDWLSRPDGDSSGRALFANKIAAVVSAAPGPLGGIRGLPMISQLLANLGVTVLPNPLAVAHAGQAFDATGALANDTHRERLDSLCQRLVKACRP